ncbi:NUDIX hydrolase [Verrucomicrobium sp. BvORR106]|uniref:NUDIX domain-containing protein n=1 Tax=Verrucomicrobium sp. BvORR106 TaxID=1403819 RepID=UPI000570D82D|nr:NUDIX hydrolase [Verrucomicrobium sp. BvORR106]
MENPWTTLSTREVYHNPWIRIREDQVINPSGGPGIYGVVEFQNRAVGVIPIDDQGYTWLVGQYRYCHESYEWEIPEGGCPAHEELVDCAKRELLEETGIIAQSYELILDGMQLSNSTTNEVAYIYTARGLSFTKAAPEDTEKIDVKKVLLEEAIEMARNGTIRDGMSVMGLLWLGSQP